MTMTTAEANQRWKDLTNRRARVALSIRERGQLNTGSTAAELSALQTTQDALDAEIARVAADYPAAVPSEYTPQL